MPIPEGGNAGKKVSPGLKAGEEYEFGDMTFPLPGVYAYSITEFDEGLENYKYDKAIFSVVYEVTQDGDALKVVRTISKDGKDVGDIAAFEFTNVYEKKEDPTEPTVKPDDPTKPTEPTKPTDPTKPTEPTTKKSDTPSKSPQTNDTSNISLWLMILVLAAGGLFAAVVAIRKRSHR